MSPSTSACPHCGGSPTGPPDAQGVRTCARCSRSWLPDGRLVVAVQRTRLVPWIVGLLMAAAMGASVAVLLGPRSRTPERPPPPAPPAPAQAAPDLPATPGLPAESVPLPALATTPPLEPIGISAPGRPPVTWTLHRRVHGTGVADWRLGTLRNDSQETLDRPQVHAVSLDASGRVVAAHGGYAARERLAPGETSPVVVLIRDPVPHAREVFVANVREADWMPPEVPGLTVLSEEPAEDEVFGWRFSGLVRHDGQVPAKHVKVEITAWDDDDRLSGVVETYAGAEVLAPGETAPFRTTAHRLEGDLDRVAYVVHATAAEFAELPAPTPEAPE